MNPTVCKCKFCGRLYKLYPHQVVQGDPSCCSFCNAQADAEQYAPARVDWGSEDDLKTNQTIYVGPKIVGARS
jgi:hypothetical protein